MAAVLSLLALAQGCGLIRPPEAPNTCRPHTLWHAQQPQPFPSGGTVAPATGKALAFSLNNAPAWLQIDPAGVPPEKLARISLKGRMSSTGGNVQVSDAAFELDDLKGSGGVAITFSVPLAIVTSDANVTPLPDVVTKPADADASVSFGPNATALDTVST